MMRWKSTLGAVAVCVSLLACAAPLEGMQPNPDCSSCDEVEELTIIRGADVEWARCWVDKNITGESDPFFQRDQISCALNQVDSSFAPARVNVTFTDNAGEVDSLRLDAALLEDSHTVLAAAEGTYPITVGLSVELATSATTGRHFKTEFVIEENSFAYETPKLVTQPFDLWPVAVRDEGLSRFWLMADYEIALGPDFRAGDANASFADMVSTTAVSYNVSAVTGEALNVQIPVPANDENFFLSSRFRTRQASTINEGTVDIDQPGVFLASEAGVQPL